MKNVIKYVFLFCAVSICGCGSGDGLNSRNLSFDTVWEIDNLRAIGGRKMTVLGSPKVIETARGGAVEFDGVGDGLIR
ncbi:MAG: hypothetical protein ACYTEQ_21045 [Planctomycetota bacterium]|jgi:hypothetical protein